MRLIALRDLNGKTQTITKGAIFELPKDKAIPLIEAGIITPEGRVAYKVYSSILQAFLWVTEDEAGADKLRAEGISEPIYTGHEIENLKDIDKEGLKTVQKIKQIFEKSKIEDIS